jgi:hypothetical protein
MVYQIHHLTASPIASKHITRVSLVFPRPSSSSSSSSRRQGYGVRASRRSKASSGHMIKTIKPVLLQRTHTTHPPPCRTNSPHHSRIHPRAHTATLAPSPRANHPFTRRSMATSISSLRTFCTVYQYAPAQNVNNAPAMATFPPLRDWCRALNDIAR